VTVPQVAVARPPLASATTPGFGMPAGACDTHLHIFGGLDEFPPVAGNTENPAPGTLDDWVDRLRHHFSLLGLRRGVLVHSVIYSEDNSLTSKAIRRLGVANFRGVALVRPDVTAAQLDDLHDAGFRGVRLNLSFTGALDLPALERVAPLLADRDWHVLVNLPRYVGLDLTAIADRLAHLGIPVVLDHYGYPDLDAGVAAPAFQTYLALLETGRFWIKLSASYRQCPPPYDRLDPFVDAMAKTNPDRLLWASDWPHVRWSGDMPDNGIQLNALARQIPNPEFRRKMLVDNPAELYGFAPV